MEEMKENVDNGELETSDDPLLPNQDSSTNFRGSVSIDSFIDDLLKNARTCTHTHTCNPPGPESAHTHTCYHTHTQVLASEDDHTTNKEQEHSDSKSRRPSGNREAVRKYREKKKAHAAYLEEEVRKLRIVNQTLVKKLQRQAVLEAEVLRLRSLLVDLRGKIDNELGSFPYQKQCNTSSFFKEGDCELQAAGGVLGLQCRTDSPCFHSHVGSSSQVNDSVNGKMVAQWKGNCQHAIVDCQANINEISSADPQTMDAVEPVVSSATQPD
ncbi:Basic-leucine zipper transcription factor [Parasponia andersonii]|uniref:Basic-leucine zipper transcription factor n=1 Tax=Parasponia andersonii TaxID=3476 RepID=A0A2P5DM32_PARAD|nr:Basic-leucine zipper transcription factor [Parasponia andersonii]